MIENRELDNKKRRGTVSGPGSRQFYEIPMK